MKEQDKSEEFEPISQDDYLNLFRVDKDVPSADKSLQEKALNFALDIRKFEIELYWKRAGYFWTFIGATLAGFFAVQNSNVNDKTFWSVVIGCLGFVFSFAWYCVNRGSKQWQENWENHVDLLEDNIIGPLYKVVTRRPKEKSTWYQSEGIWARFKMIITGPAPFSVSKVNQIVSLFVTLLWALLVFKILWPFRFDLPIDWEYVIIIGFTLIACLTMMFLGRTDKWNYKNLTATKRTTTIENKSANNANPADP